MADEGDLSLSINNPIFKRVPHEGVSRLFMDDQQKSEERLNLLNIRYFKKFASLSIRAIHLLAQLEKMKRMETRGWNPWAELQFSLQVEEDAFRSRRVVILVGLPDS